MISKIMPCSRKCLYQNERLYLEVTNETPYYVYVMLQYKIHGREILNPSPVFGPGKIRHMNFPTDTTSIRFIAFCCAYNPPGLICTKSISNYMSSRYKIVGPSYGNLQCIEIDS